MQRQFASKSVTLTANVQSTLQWGAAEFSSTLGQDQAVPNFPFSVAFQVANNTTQVCYIGVAYQTRYNSYNLADRRAIAAIPAGTTLNITPASVPGLASIGPDVTDITMTLISAGAGNVTVLLIVDEPQPTGSGGTQGFFGLDQRSGLDYTFTTLRLTGAISSATDQTADYTVPTGKRAFITSLLAYIESTPYQDADILISVIVNGISVYSFQSSMREDVRAIYAGELWIAGEGQLVRLSAFSLNPSITITHNVDVLITIKETF